jgi:hypothetical protein
MWFWKALNEFIAELLSLDQFDVENLDPDKDTSLV